MKIESINSIFANGPDREKLLARKKFIGQVASLLSIPRLMDVKIGRKTKSVDCRVISIRETNPSETPIVLLPGYGSGWEGIAELGFSLACEGRTVLMASLPGYGNSFDPPQWYYEAPGFVHEASMIFHLVSSVFPQGQKLHLIGHSMGAEILATFAMFHSERIASLVLLNPSGIKGREEHLSRRFILSGIRTALEFQVRMVLSGERDYEQGIKRYIPKTKSPFTRDRMAQRKAEARKLREHGSLVATLRQIHNAVPIIYISGTLDAVYPPASYLPMLKKSLDRSIHSSIMERLRHNTTLASDEIVAANIEHYLELAEKQ